MAVKSCGMKLEAALWQRSYLYFVLFFLLAIFGFWLTYFTRIFEQESYRMHLHGLALILWCLMLIVQPYLIRSKKNRLHKSIGKFSYLLVPFMLFSTVDLLKFKIDKNAALDSMDYHFIALVINALIAFVLFYGLAIYYRKQTTVHARFMVCTAFPMVTPITDRIIHIHFPSLLAYFPQIEGNPIAPVFGFALADLILLGLSIWDWRSHRRWNVFPLVLLVLLAYHYSVLNFHQFAFWQSFCNWFFQL